METSRFLDIPAVSEPVDVLQFLGNLPDGAPDGTRSTRDAAQTPQAWDKALVSGLAPDGGLFVPGAFPAFEDAFFRDTLPQLGMPQIAAALLRRFVPRSAIGDAQLLAFTEKALDFGLPLEDISKLFEGENVGEVLIAWLDRGPTASFKDFAAQTLGQLLEWWCEANQQPKNIVVATSGDTGVAIAQAFAGSRWITVMVLYPAGGVAAPQEAQMQTVAAAHANIRCLPCEGSFDDQQARAKILQKTLEREQTVESTAWLIAELKAKVKEEVSEADAEFILEKVGEANLMSANSINFWRLLPQMTQFFTSYAQLVHSGKIAPGEKIWFAVPTGNAGHITAGLYAQQLGLPIAGFTLATNQNDILHNLLTKGMLQQDAYFQTNSNSMDIEKPNNLERLLKLACEQTGGAAIDFDRLEKALADKTRVQNGIDPHEFGVTANVLAWLRERIKTGSATDAECAEVVAKTYNKTGAVVEWHGAAATKVVREQAAAGVFNGQKVVILETAAIGKARPGSLEAVLHLPELPPEYANPNLQAAIEKVKSAAGEPDLAAAVEKGRGKIVTSTRQILEEILENSAESAARRANDAA